MRRLTFILALGVVAVGGERVAAEPGRTASTEAGRRHGDVVFAEWFADAALRVDLYHTGDARAESFSLDEIVREPLWPGRRSTLLDPTGYGAYRFRVFDARSETEIYSQGYASLFGEWMTTEEARSGPRRTLHESLRFPFPLAPVHVVVEGRDRRGRFRRLFAMDVDPAHYSVRWERRYDFAVMDILSGPPPDQATDILILGDGYTRDEVDKLRADARRLTDVLLAHEPYRRSSGHLAVRAIEVASRESGADEPRKGIWRDTALGCSFNTFDAERYLTTTHNEDLVEIASLAPYDTVVVMVNTGRYGGGGIYNFFTVFAADAEYGEYLLLHEFAHGFGALGDEYYDPNATSYDDAQMYPPGVEPWEPNITALLSPRELKWRDLVDPSTPLPTPASDEHADRVGAFEGAGYRARGLYRPCLDSIMLHKGNLPYCPVSERAIERMIRLNVGEGWS